MLLRGNVDSVVRAPAATKSRGPFAREFENTTAHRPGRARRRALEIPIAEVFQVAPQVGEGELLDRGRELGLVVLDGDRAVAAAGDDLLLAAHRVDRDQRTGQVDLLQELRDGGDVV